MKYSINKEAIIFLDIDKGNNFHTIAYDFQSDDVVAIRPVQYHLLMAIYEHQPIPYDQLVHIVQNILPEKDFKKTTSDLLAKNVLNIHE